MLTHPSLTGWAVLTQSNYYKHFLPLRINQLLASGCFPSFQRSTLFWISMQALKYSAWGLSAKTVFFVSDSFFVKVNQNNYKYWHGNAVYVSPISKLEKLEKTWEVGCKDTFIAKFKDSIHQTLFVHSKVKYWLRDAPQKNKRDFLGIFPKGGGGSFQIPKLL